MRYQITETNHPVPITVAVAIRRAAKRPHKYSPFTGIGWTAPYANNLVDASCRRGRGEKR